VKTTMKITDLPKSTQELYALAKAVRERSYSPYSGAKVGAAIRDRNGGVFTGCNVENSSYGATTCAERTAVQKAVSEQGGLDIAEIVVVTDATPAWAPCGICRQVIAEFARGQAGTQVPVHMANLEGEVHVMKFGELYPGGFTPDHLAQGDQDRGARSGAAGAQAAPKRS
jgi:cytidine deaminase